METFSFETDMPLPSLRDAVSRFQKTAPVRGWIREGGGCLQVMSRHADELRAALSISIWTPGPHTDHFLFRRFEVLPKPNGSLVSRIAIDDPGSRGRITGTAVANDGEPMAVEVKIDGATVGVVVADRFRRDLLVAGHRTGCAGFDVAVPASRLDGRQHEIVVQQINGDAVASKRAVLPFHYTGPMPWIGHADEMARCREAVARGERDSISRVREVIDRKPSAIFTDFGFEENARDRDVSLPTFRELLKERSGLWNGGTFCGVEDCCKRRGLDMRRVYERAKEHFGTTNPAVLRDKCRHWPRMFASKLFIKEYAERFGVRTPKTIAVLDTLDGVQRSDLPNRCVIKPEASSGVLLYLMHGDINLLDGREVAWTEVQAKMRPATANGQKIIVEEFLVQEGVDAAAPVIPLDYKLHAFGGRVRLIHVDDRNHLSRDPLRRRQGWFARDWTPSPLRFRVNEVEFYRTAPPSRFQEMLDIADRMAADVGDYIRVDLYATTDGFHLGEVTTTTHNGVGFTAFGEMVLRQLWAVFPNMER